MAERTAAVRAEFKDDFTAQAAVAEAQARRTGDAFEDMGAGADKGTDGLKRHERQTKRTQKEAKGLDRALEKLNMRGGAMRYIFKAAMPVVFVIAIRSLIPLVGALSAGLLALAGNLGRVAGMAGTLPGILVALGGGIAAVVVGFRGIGEAVKSLNEGDPNKINEALKDLSPTARALAGDLASLDPTLKTLRHTASEALLPGVRQALALMLRALPEVNFLLARMGGVMGSLARDAATMVSSGPWRRDFVTITNDSAYALRQAGVGGLGLMDALRHVAVAAGPVLRQLGDLVAKGGAWAARAAEAGRESGRLGRFMQRSFDTMRQWGRILSNLTAGLFGIFRGGAELGDTLTESIERSTRRFRDWANSVGGQRKISRWFNEMRPAIRETVGLVGDLGRALFSMTTGPGEQTSLVQLLQTARKAVPPLASLMNSFGPGAGEALLALVTSLVRLINALPLIPIVGVMNFVSAVLRVVTAVPGLKQLVAAFVAVGVATKGIGALDKMLGISRLYKWLTVVNVETGKTAAQMAILKAWTTAQAVATRIAAAAQWVWNAAMSANPLLLIVAALVAVGAAVYLAYKRFKPFRDFVDGTWQVIQAGAKGLWNWIKSNWPLLLAILTGPFGLAIYAIQRNWDSIVAGARAARDWVVGVWDGVYDFFAKLPGRIANVARGMWDSVWEEFRKVFDRITNFEVLGVSLNDVGGVARGALDAINPLGDTSRPRGHSGSLTRTLGAHAHLERATSGHRRVTNATYGAYAGSDHRHGRALDLVGSGLNGYKRNLEAQGGYAAFHGSGRTRHLHAVYGDTTTPRRSTLRSAGGDGFTLVIDGPLVGQVIAHDELDLERAIKRGIQDAERERRERT